MTGRSVPTQELNLGRIFVSAFRWLLLLLFALVIQKGIEGVAFRVGGTPHFASSLATVENLWKYLGGILQVLITFLFAIRYVICFVDPFERIAGLDLTVTWSRKEIIEKLRTVQPHHAGLVSLIALVEFSLLTHASLSLISLLQWLWFLFSLAVFDSFIFFLGGAFFERLKVCWERLRIGALEIFNKVLSRGGNNALENYLSEEKKCAEERMSRLKGAVNVYGIWNLVDIIILAAAFDGACLFVYEANPLSGGVEGRELIFLTLMCLVVVIETVINFRKLASTYMLHIRVFVSV